MGAAEAATLARRAVGVRFAVGFDFESGFFFAFFAEDFGMKPPLPNWRANSSVYSYRMGELIALLLEMFVELLAESFFLMLSRTFEEVSGDEGYPPFIAFVAYGSFGVIAGGISLALFPHPLVHPSRIHGISLIISPLLTGLVMWCIGHMQRRRGKDTARIESFTYGFAFALGMALIRFFFVR